jgi:hypothetical protein
MLPDPISQQILYIVIVIEALLTGWEDLVIGAVPVTTAEMMIWMNCPQKFRT